MQNTVHLYTQTREQIRATLAEVSERCEPDADGQKRVVFYGLGDVAEIAYISLQSTDLMLVGVVDDRRRGRFFDLSICGSEQLSAESLDGVAYSHVIVTSVRHADAIQAKVSGRGVPQSRVSRLA
jgi:hypothetical protein